MSIMSGEFCSVGIQASDQVGALVYRIDGDGHAPVAGDLFQGPSARKSISGGGPLGDCTARGAHG